MHVLGPTDATTDAHTLFLSTWAWWRLCNVLYAQESGAGIGCPPGQGHWDAADISADFVHIFRDSRRPIFEAPTPRRKICGQSAQKSAHQKSVQVVKSAHNNSAQNLHAQNLRTRIVLNILSLEAGSQKEHNKICAKLAQNPSHPKVRIY